MLFHLVQGVQGLPFVSGLSLFLSFGAHAYSISLFHNSIDCMERMCTLHTPQLGVSQVIKQVEFCACLASMVFGLLHIIDTLLPFCTLGEVSLMSGLVFRYGSRPRSLSFVVHGYRRW